MSTVISIIVLYLLVGLGISLKMIWDDGEITMGSIIGTTFFTLAWPVALFTEIEHEKVIWRFRRKR